MNKTELVAAMAEKAELSKKDAESALKAFVDVVTDELKKVEEVETIVTGLISMDFTYKQIEQMLKDRFIKKIDKTA